MSVYINTIKANAEDLRTLKRDIKNGKNRIKRIVLFKNKVRVYTVF